MQSPTHEITSNVVCIPELSLSLFLIPRRLGFDLRLHLHLHLSCRGRRVMLVIVIDMNEFRRPVQRARFKTWYLLRTQYHTNWMRVLPGQTTTTTSLVFLLTKHRAGRTRLGQHFFQLALYAFIAISFQSPYKVEKHNQSTSFLSGLPSIQHYKFNHHGHDDQSESNSTTDIA